jgi:hypothetical protein
MLRIVEDGRGDFGGTMGLWKTIKSLFASGGGWITLSEARHLFSRMDDQYAFGEMDDVGKSNLGAFAAQSGHRSSVDIMPVEGRVYFTRKTRA